MNEVLLSRIEDAGLNASAPPQQRWLDGWLVRLSPGKAKRARCIHAVAVGRRPLADKLGECQALYREAGLPLFFRITPFTQPATLDADLARLGFVQVDDTRVMVLPSIADADKMPLAVPDGTVWTTLAAADFAQVVGALRGTSAAGRQAHAERLTAAPVPGQAFALSRDGAVLACGQFVHEGGVVGLYDLHTRDDARRQGLATHLCQRLLSLSASAGAATAYLQVDLTNTGARRIYQRAGFSDAYAYHYREALD